MNIFNHEYKFATLTMPSWRQKFAREGTSTNAQLVEKKSDQDKKEADNRPFDRIASSALNPSLFVRLNSCVKLNIFAPISTTSPSSKY